MVRAQHAGYRREAAVMNVSRICNAEHSVTFTKNGWNTMHIGAGQETKLHRVDKVYRLKTGVHGGDSGFSRPGC